MATQVVIVSESEVSRVGMRELIQQSPNILVTGLYGCVQQMSAHIEASGADVVVLSDQIGMKALIEALHFLLAHSTSRAIVVVDTWTSDKLAELGALGVWGFLCHTDPLSIGLPAAVEKVMQDELYFSPAAVRKLLPTTPGRSPLNPRQMQVLRFMARGYTPQEIAVQMKTSTGAVYAIQYRIRRLIHVRTTSLIIAEALRYGWLEES